MGDLDLAIFRAINGWPESMAPFWRFFSEATNLMPVRILLLALVVAMIARGPRTRVAILLAMLAWPLANEACDLWKASLQDPRPFQVLPDVWMRAGKSGSFGSASAHSANMAAIAAVMTFRLGRWGWIWIGIALLTGLSRVYVGVHFPRQVLLGWTTGIVVGLLIAWIAEKRFPRNPPQAGIPAEPDEVPPLVGTASSELP